MKKLFLLIFPTLLLLISCNSDKPEARKEFWKQEIVETELAFSKMAGDSGIQKAFVAFAADDAVLMRNNALVNGVDEIAENYKSRSQADPNNVLEWEPEFVEVAASGDLGYTYGPYTFTTIDSNGVKTENKGIFHTVWKRQADGSWKFVWD